MRNAEAGAGGDAEAEAESEASEAESEASEAAAAAEEEAFGTLRNAPSSSPRLASRSSPPGSLRGALASFPRARIFLNPSRRFLLAASFAARSLAASRFRSFSSATRALASATLSARVVAENQRRPPVMRRCFETKTPPGDRSEER